MKKIRFFIALVSLGLVIECNTSNKSNTFDISDIISPTILTHTDSDYAAHIISRIDSSKTDKITNKQHLLTKDSALKIAEPLLFKTYGEARIKDERPYTIVKYKDYWVIWGSMHCDNCFGGVFEIAISDATGKVECLIHGK